MILTIDSETVPFRSGSSRLPKLVLAILYSNLTLCIDRVFYTTVQRHRGFRKLFVVCENSAPNLPAVPGQSCHPFRRKAAGYSGVNLPLSASEPERVADFARNRGNKVFA